MGGPVAVDSKQLTLTLNALESTLTKNPGGPVLARAQFRLDTLHRVPLGEGYLAVQRPLNLFQRSSRRLRHQVVGEDPRSHTEQRVEPKRPARPERLHQAQKRK